jgi:hypothetical protein
MGRFGRLVAARYRDGRIVKGWTADFRPEGTHFHVTEDGTDRPTEIYVHDLKGLFFIKTPEGNPDRKERKDFVYEGEIGRKTWIEFKDGEQLAGWAGPLLFEDEGFYILPVDPDSNMEKAYVFRAQLRRVLHGEDADRAARAYARANRDESVGVERWDAILRAK